MAEVPETQYPLALSALPLVGDEKAGRRLSFLLLHQSLPPFSVSSLRSSTKRRSSMLGSRFYTSWRFVPFLHPSPLSSSSTSPQSLVSSVRSSRREEAWPVLASRRQQQQAEPTTKKRPGRRKGAQDVGAEEKPQVEVLPNPNSEALQKNRSGHPTSPLPKPPAGFVVDTCGKVLLASNKRIATIVDTTNNLPLDCVIRRVFQSSSGEECMLLCPADMPVQILKSTNFDGWSTVYDDEIEAIIPAAAYALAKIHMHLVVSGFCYTARGGFCYSEDDILEFHTDDGDDIEGLPTEAIEITCFNQDGKHYMIYTPSDPMLFVATKNENGILQIADDELLEDPAIIAAIDEETEFNALVEEESALLESLIGKR